MTFSLFPTIARLAGVEPGDEGEYECQVSTETKLSSIKHLQVIQPQVLNTKYKYETFQVS